MKSSCFTIEIENRNKKLKSKIIILSNKEKKIKNLKLNSHF